MSRFRRSRAKPDRTVEGEGFSFEGEYPVLERAVMGDKVVVLYDYSAFEKETAARNLFCYTRSGDFVWRAAAVNGSPADAYTHIHGVNPLWVSNFTGVDCRIDEHTGAVLKKKFTK